MNCECCSSRGVLEKFNIHRVLFCNINICFGHFLWNSLSQRFEEYVSTLHSKCIPAKLNWESSLPPSLVDSFPPAGSKSFPWHWRHLLRWNCDTADIHWGETVTCRHAWGGAAEQRPETSSVLWEEIVCVPSLQVLSSKCSFGISSFAYPIIVHFSLAFFEGLFFQRKCGWRSFLIPHIYYCWVTNVFLLWQCEPFSLL